MRWEKCFGDTKGARGSSLNISVAPTDIVCAGTHRHKTGKVDIEEEKKIWLESPLYHLPSHGGEKFGVLCVDRGAVPSLLLLTPFNNSW